MVLGFVVALRVTTGYVEPRLPRRNFFLTDRMRPVDMTGARAQVPPGSDSAN